MPKFIFEKLVRDNVPSKLKSRNIRYKRKAISRDEYIVELKKKLLEEANEVLAAKSHDNYVEEISDLLEVIDVLRKNLNVSIDEVEKRRVSKRLDYGSLEESVYIEYAEIDNDNPAIEYYRSHPTQYPEEK